MKMTCLIVDDEPAARKGLAADLTDIGYLEMIGSAVNAFEALELIHHYSPDLVFLDIEMPGMSGLDFLKLLKIKPIIIFTTAYQQYALNGYELGVLDYLLKPISAERLRNACDKALEIFSYKKNGIVKAELSEFIFLKCNGKMEKIMLAEILYVEAANNYVFVHTINRRLITYHTLKGMEAQLPSKDFIKVHKSFIVSKSRIIKAAKNEIILTDQTKIPLSKNFKHDFQKVVIAENTFYR